jgi:hypothetical protein
MATFVREYERVTCPGCLREISAYIPHFGDGSGLRVVKHNVKDGRSPCGVGGQIIVRNQARGPAQGKWRLE